MSKYVRISFVLCCLLLGLYAREHVHVLEACWGLFLVFSLIAKRNEDGGSAPSPSGGDVVSSAYCHEALAVVFQDLAWGKAET